MRIALQELWGLFRYHKLLSLVLIAGITISFLTVHLMYGLIEFTFERSLIDTSGTTYTLDFGQEMTDTEHQTLLDLLDNDDRLNAALLLNITDGQPMTVGFYGENNNYWFIQDEGNFFTTQQVENCDQVAVVSYAMATTPALDYQDFRVEISDQSFDVIGFGTLNPYQFFIYLDSALYTQYVSTTTVDETTGVVLSDQSQVIPYTTFLELGLSSQLVRLQYLVEDRADYDMLTAELIDLFPDVALYIPTMNYFDTIAALYQELWGSLLLIVMALVNITALFIYWLGLMRKSHWTYHACGATKSQLFKIILFEWLLLVLISFILALLLGFLLQAPISTLGISLSFAWWQYATIFVCIYLITIAFMAKQLYRTIYKKGALS